MEIYRDSLYQETVNIHNRYKDGDCVIGYLKGSYFVPESGRAILTVKLFDSTYEMYEAIEDGRNFIEVHLITNWKD